MVGLLAISDIGKLIRKVYPHTRTIVSIICTGKSSKRQTMSSQSKRRHNTHRASTTMSTRKAHVDDVIAIMRQTSLQYGHRCRCLDPPVVNPVISVRIVVLSVEDDTLVDKGVERSWPDVLDVKFILEIGMCLVDEMPDASDAFTVKSGTGVDDDDVSVIFVADLFITFMISVVEMILVVCWVEDVVVVEIILVVVVGSAILQRFAMAL